MSDDKITITMGEVEKATPVPGTPPSPYAYNPPPAATSVPQPGRTGFRIMAAIVAAVAIVCIAGLGVVAYVGIGRGEGGKTVAVAQRTVSDFRKEWIRDLNEDLSSPDSKLRKRIESEHWIVTVKSADVTECTVTTLDGTDNAGVDDANISKVTTRIRFYWTGLVEPGHTDLRVVYDVHNKRVIESKIVDTDALVNVEDAGFWWDFGIALGLLLGA